MESEVELIEKQIKLIHHRGSYRDIYEIVRNILQFIASKYDCRLVEVV